MKDKSSAVMESIEAAKTLADQVHAAKENFLTQISREMRTPLRSIAATLSIIKEQSIFDAEAREYLEFVRRNVELDVRHIDDLLDITRINPSKTQISKRPVDISAIVSRTAEACRPDIEFGHLSFELDIKQSPHLVNGDAVRLRQMFWSLIRSAIKFTPPGGEIRVQCLRQDGEALVVVSDNSAKSDADATVDVKAIAELHGGKFEVSSDRNARGRKFTVRLPIAASASASTDIN